MRVVKAHRRLMHNVPDILTGVISSLFAWILAYTLNSTPDLGEILLFGLCSTGAFYHLSDFLDARRDLLAIMSWEDHDAADVDAVNDNIRREQARVSAKFVFGVATLIMIVLPPRAIEVYEDYTQLVIFLVAIALIALDIDAVLSRQSRMRQIALIKTDIHRRRLRRERLQRQLKPLINELVETTSTQGRWLIHDLFGHLSIIVGTSEMIKQDLDIKIETRVFVDSLDETIIQMTTDLTTLQEIMHGLSIEARVREAEGGCG